MTAMISSEDKKTSELCSPFKVTDKEYKQLLEAIEENYYFEFIVGELN